MEIVVIGGSPRRDGRSDAGNKKPPTRQGWWMRSGVRVSWVARLDTPPALHGRRATRTGAAQRDAGHRCRIVARTCLSRQEARRLQLGGGRRQRCSTRIRCSVESAGEERQQPGTLVGQGRRVALRQRPDRPERERRPRPRRLLALDAPRPGDEPVEGERADRFLRRRAHRVGHLGAERSACGPRATAAGCRSRTGSAAAPGRPGPAVARRAGRTARARTRRGR